MTEADRHMDSGSLPANSVDRLNDAVRHGSPSRRARPSVRDAVLPIEQIKAEAMRVLAGCADGRAPLRLIELRQAIWKDRPQYPGYAVALNRALNELVRVGVVWEELLDPRKGPRSRSPRAFRFSGLAADRLQEHGLSWLIQRYAPRLPWGWRRGWVRPPVHLADLPGRRTRTDGGKP